MTHVLNRWNKNKSSIHSSTCALISDESVALNIYFIEIKYCYLSFMIYSESYALYVVMLR